MPWCCLLKGVAVVGPDDKSPGDVVLQYWDCTSASAVLLGAGIVQPCQGNQAGSGNAALYPLSGPFLNLYRCEIRGLGANCRGFLTPVPDGCNAFGNVPHRFRVDNQVFRERRSVGGAYAHRENGLITLTPVGSKSLTLRVTTVRP